MTPTPFFVLVVLLVVGLPIGWLASEFHAGRRLRITLGVLSILMCFGVAWIAGSLTMFNANAWFGGASKSLIDSTLEELEAGNVTLVVEELRRLQEQYAPTYENRARYDRLVEETVQRMKSRHEPLTTTQASNQSDKPK